jgi:hypothetical protein
MAGAYMFVVSDFISRSRRMDFSPADVMWGSLRLFISVPLGLSLGSILDPHVVAFVAFGLGAFPLQTIQLALRQLSYRQLQLELGTTEKSELLNLNGVDMPLAERLSNEDISSIVQLSYCDPIQITMRTNLSFSAVADLVSQALAWNYFERRLDPLRLLGLRGAWEIRQFMEDLKAQNEDSDVADNRVQRARNLIPAISSCLGLSEDKIWFVFYQIASDQYTDFIYFAWEPLQPA